MGIWVLGYMGIKVLGLEYMGIKVLGFMGIKVLGWVLGLGYMGIGIRVRVYGY